MNFKTLSRAAFGGGAFLVCVLAAIQAAAAGPNAAYLNAAWVAKSDGVVKLSTDTGAVLLELGALQDARALAIDDRRGLLWSYGGGVLRATTFAGVRQWTVTVPGATDDDDDDDAVLSVNRENGSVWLALEERLHHFGPQGALLRTRDSRHGITAMAMDAQRGQLWVATEESLQAYDNGGAVIRTIALGRDDEIADISFDASLKELWVATEDELRRYDVVDGKPVFAQRRKDIEHLASAGGGVWVATKEALLRLDAHGAPLFAPQRFSGNERIRRLAADSAHRSVWAMANQRLIHVGPRGEVRHRLSFQRKLRFLAIYTDSIPPVLGFTAPAAESYLRDNQPILWFTHSDAHIGVDPPSLRVTRLGDHNALLPLPVRCEHTPSISACLPTNALADGYYGLFATIRDYAGNVSPLASTTVTIDTVPPTITLSSPEADLVTAQTEVTVSGSVNEPATLTLNGQELALDTARRFSQPFTLALGANTLAFSAKDRAGNVANLARRVTVIQNSVPNPVDVASPIDPTVATALATATAFLYTGTNPIQKNVVPGTIEARRAAVLRGQVATRGNAPLAGVTITILGQPKYGHTRTRADGLFDMAVNGGGVITVQYEKAGFLPVQRQVEAPWQDYAWADPVVMIPLDPQVTAIDLAAQTAITVARGSVQTDADGRRQATLLFSPGTQATMTLADGSTRPLGTLHVRATEYTVGANGPATMPGPLPPTSAYTYAVELSVDEAIAAGARSVSFSQPVYNYVENFLNFPVGGIVPSGYYDRKKAAWIPSPNGRVIKILSVSGGQAVIDGNGDNVADTEAELAALQLTAAERATLAGLYQPGQSFWRVPITHFTPWDYNWPFGPPADATAPRQPEPTIDDKEDDPCLESGSIIECENQVLRERLPIAGTPFTLNYSSARVPGRSAAYTMTIPLSGRSVPAGLQRIDVRVHVAGRRLFQSFPAAPNQSHRFAWDGQDAYGRRVIGPQRATVEIGYVYRAVYHAPATFAQSFAAFSGVPLSGNPGRSEITLWQTHHASLGGAIDARAKGLGAWELNAHHVYAADAKMLFLGTGRQRQAGSIAAIISTVAGTGAIGYSGDGGPATRAMLSSPAGLASGPDGSLYIADWANDRVRRIGPDGIITTVAGNGTWGDGQDGQPATQTPVAFPQAVAVGAEGSLYAATEGRVRRVGPDGLLNTVAQIGDHTTWISSLAVARDGSLYVVDANGYQVRRIGPDGVITPVAGNGTWGYSGDGGPATQARLGVVRGIAIAPDGSLMIADRSSPRIRRVGQDGIITTVAGNGGWDSSGDGGPATQAGLGGLQGIAVAADGSLYIAESGRIRRVGSDGIITTVAGNGGWDSSGDGGPATQAGLGGGVSGIAVAADGSLYVSEGHRIRRVGAPVPGVSHGHFLIPAEDGSELYQFSSSGRHLRTLDALTGAVIHAFGYDPHGLLSTITDGDGNITRIERDAAGLPQAIIAPQGQRTTLALDANGYLAAVSNPATETTRMVYTAGGLLTTFTNANNHRSTLVYDDGGRLQKNSNAAQGSWTLARDEFAGGHTASLTSALGRSKRYRVERLSTGDQRRTVTSPTGAVSSTLTQTNGSTVTTAADGTVRTQVEGPDPRFGMQAPIITSLTVKTPSGLTSTVATRRAATLVNADDPLSLQTLTDTVTVNGRSSTSTYTAATRTRVSTSAAGRRSTATFDAQGRVLSQSVPGLAPVGYQYDGRGRLTQVSQGAGTEARIFALSYDAQGNVDAITDALNRTQRMAHDPVGRLRTVTTSDRRVIGFDYDKVGNVTALTPPERPAHGFAYTPVDRESAYTPPSVAGVANPATAFRYNPDQQPTDILRADGQSLVFDYEANGRLKQLAAQGSPAAAAVQTDFGYVGNTSRIASIRAASGVGLAYQYDGALLREERASGPVAGTLNRAYDTDFRVTALSLNGTAIALGYDADSLLTQAGDLTLTRDAQNGLLTGTALGTLLTSQSYNGFGELSEFTAVHGSAGLYRARYRRDAAGRITEKTETLGSQTDVYRYAYDDAGRLWQVHKNAVLLSEYRYDGNGNRLSKTTPAGSLEGRVDAQDRLQSYGGITYTYSAHGDLTSKTEAGQSTRYQFDALGNLRQVELPGGARIEYVIDGHNRRVGRKVNGTLAQGLLYQDQLKPIAELDGAGNVVSRFVYATRINVPDYLIKGGVTYRIVSDHLGSPRLVVNVATGAIVQRMDFDEFGNVLADSNPGFQPFGFAGGIYDRATGLTRFGARDYDPQIGRWTAKDPIRFGGGDANLYAYVSGNPVNSIDPSGLATAVVINGPTSGNPFGHTAIAVTGSGVYSYGNGTGLGSSFTDYVRREAPRRNTDVFVLNTTAEQEAAILAHLKGTADDLPPWLLGIIPDPTDSCATRTNEALEKGGMIDPYTVGPSFPTDVVAQAEFWRQAIGGSVVNIPQGSASIPKVLLQFNP